MNSIVKQDPHYTHDNKNREVYNLTICKNDRQIISVSLTLPELIDVSEAIRNFIRNEQILDNMIFDPKEMTVDDLKIS